MNKNPKILYSVPIDEDEETEVDNEVITENNRTIILE